MEDTAFCITLLVTVILQLGAQRVDAAFWIIPTQLQVFEYESVSFKCDGLTGWNVFRKVRREVSICGGSTWGTSSEASCSITGAYADDSGEYWCEAAGGGRSNSVNITITAVPVILQSPVLPVTEGDAATLSCRNKTSTNLSAAFYKDGRLIRSSSTREMTIRRVSKADEGLYKCSISGAGESAESWLAVRALHTDTPPSSDHMFLFFRNILPLVMMAPLFVLLGILHFGNIGGSRSSCVVTASPRDASQKSDEAVFNS